MGTSISLNCITLNSVTVIINKNTWDVGISMMSLYSVT